MHFFEKFIEYVYTVHVQRVNWGRVGCAGKWQPQLFSVHFAAAECGRRFGFCYLTALQILPLKIKMPKIVIHYFDFPFWRAEVSRLALHLGKVGRQFRWCVKHGFSSIVHLLCLFASHVQKVFQFYPAIPFAKRIGFVDSTDTPY